QAEPLCGVCALYGCLSAKQPATLASAIIAGCHNQESNAGGVAMNRMVVHSRVGADGVLHLTVPLGETEADKDVEVTIAPLRKPAMTQEEWREFVLSTAGSITDPTFKRHEQGEYERREELP
ncbi:MAG: hypothetical protein ACREHD_01555, partial [Pirellulales bacterium]